MIFHVFTIGDGEDDRNIQAIYAIQEMKESRLTIDRDNGFSRDSFRGEATANDYAWGYMSSNLLKNFIKIISTYPSTRLRMIKITNMRNRIATFPM